MKLRFVPALVLLVAGLLSLGAAHASADTSSTRVLVVKLTSGPQPFSDADVNAGMQKAAGYFAAASFGKAALLVTQTLWLTALSGPLPCPIDGAAVSTLDTAIAAVADAGYAEADYDRIVLLIAQPTCLLSNDEGAILFLYTTDAGVLAHELGHSFGMGHALAFYCRYSSSGHRSCNRSADPWDIMGLGELPGSTPDTPFLGDVGALQKAAAGWLTPTYIDTPGVYRLAPLEVASTLPQALVIRTAGLEYWVDHREPLGNDAYLAADTMLGSVTAGFEVHRITGDPLAPDAAYLTPDYLMPTGPANVAETAPGHTFSVPGVFALGAVSRTDGVMTIRFRWLDKTPPSTPKITTTSGSNTATDPLSVFFRSSSDRGSGVVAYSFSVDKGAWTTTATPTSPPPGTPAGAAYTTFIHLPQLTPGKHTVTLVAIDRAGNRSTAAAVSVSAG